MSQPIFRNWVARSTYPDRETFYFGTVQAESELAALRAAEAAWAEISPHPAPSMVMLPGLLAFSPDETEL